MDKLLYLQMRSALERWAIVSPQLWNEVEAIFHPHKYNKGSYLVLPGNTFDDILFIGQGLLRFYIINDDGKEWNKGFAIENELTGQFTTQSPQWPSPHGMQALEDTFCLISSYKEFQTLCNQYADLEHIIQRYISWLLNQKGKRLQSFQEQDATARYNDFLYQYPSLAQRLPQYHIASYLGISEVSLSRIRRTISSNRS